MPIPLALALAGGGALAKFLSGFFGGKSKAKAEKERATESDAAQRRAWDQQEQARIARLKSLLSAAGARGIDIGQLDPSLLVPRPYPGPDSTKGMKGPSLWQNLLGFGGDIALGAAQAGVGGGGPAASAAGRGSLVGDDSILSGPAPKSIFPVQPTTAPPVSPPGGSGPDELWPAGTPRF